MPQPPRSPLSPYTTLFRSAGEPRPERRRRQLGSAAERRAQSAVSAGPQERRSALHALDSNPRLVARRGDRGAEEPVDRKSTRLNSSHLGISYAVFCLKKKN